MEATKRLYEVGKLIGIDILDHISLQMIHSFH
ncbi:hypothetical protein [Macrococcus armenti]